MKGGNLGRNGRGINLKSGLVDSINSDMAE
jgi:hypothetical protein